MPDFDQLRRIVREQAGDPLGLRHDVETVFAIADAAARRFIAVNHTREALDEWRTVVEALERDEVGGDGAMARACRLARRMLVDACEEWLAAGGHGTPSKHLARALDLDRNESSALGPSMATLLLDLAWQAPVKSTAHPS